MSIFAGDINLICKVVKKPVDEYTSERLKVGDTVVMSPEDYKKEVINLYFGQGDGATLRQDEIEIDCISKRVLIKDKEEIQKELDIIYRKTF